MALHWGLAGLGKISHDFFTALETKFTDSEHIIKAVASRDVKRSKEFAEEHNISKFYGSYAELAKDEDIEIVYIAVLNPFHYDVCLLMLNHGKHILCEKPFCMNYWQVKSVLDLAKSKQLFAMEGVWSRFFPTYELLRNLINSKYLHDIREVYIKHGFKGDTSKRIIKKEFGGGIVLDIGVYAIQLVVMCFQEDPIAIKATGKINGDGVDLCFEAEIQFSKGFAKITCSGMEEYENQAVIISKKGTVCLPNYWCATSLIEPDCNVRSWWLPEPTRKMNFLNSCGLRYEADEVLKCIRSKKLFSERLLPKEMLLIAHIEDEIRRQIGVHYDCDKP